MYRLVSYLVDDTSSTFHILSTNLAMHSLFPFVLTALVSLSSAADCSGPRPSNGPSGADLAKLAKAKLDDACGILSGSTGPAWSQYPNQGYYYQGSNPKAVLADSKFCHDSFEQIIDQCITNGEFYGGQFFFDHQIFNLTNAKGKDSPIGVSGYVNPPSPPSFPDDSGIKFFEGMKCGFGSIGNAQSPGELRWGEAGCDDALQRFNAQWDPSTSNLNYVASMSSFWHGPEDWTCTVRQDKCVAGVQACGDSDTSGPNGHSITNPAAWIILNSFSNIYNFYFNQFLSFTLAQNDISPQIHDFASKFSPVPRDDTEILKLILDVLSMGYGQIAAGAWNTVLKDASIFKDGTLNHGWSKDGVNNIISGMITTGKDLLPGKKDAIGRENDLTSMLNTLVQAYEDTTSGFLNNIFGGSSDGITALTSMLDNGKWIDPTFNGGKQLDLPTMRGIVEKILFAQLMPLAWKDVGGLHPVVLIDDKICSGGSGDFDANLYITKDQQNAVGACYKSPAGDHSVGLYLVRNTRSTASRY